MSIKKYNTFHHLSICHKVNRTSTKKVPRVGKINKAYQKSIFGIVIVFILFIGIKLFFDLPLMNIFTEEKIQSDGSDISRNPGSDQTGDSQEVFPVNGEEPENRLHQIALNRAQITEKELDLQYQEAQQEEIKIVSGSLNSGETLYQYLVENDIPPAEILNLQEKIESVVDISCLNIGTKFSVHYDCAGRIVQFDYQPNQLDVYHIKISQGELSNIEVSKDEIFREIVCFEGVIESSLYQAMVDYCHSDLLAVQLAEIFAWDIDFLTECQAGDKFKILVEKLYRGDFYRWGDILAAVYEGELLSTHTAILFEEPDGNTSYYDENGQCLEKAFLKAPLNYKYISSYFSKSRFHPILRIWRPHLGIDYAAPTGTPVVSIGGGTVIAKYYDQGGYGNYVQIRHPNGYVTGYGHLSKYAQGLQVGKRVEQGELIGYVGATGLATGPHLDFSISKDGKRINFLELELPPASSVNNDYLDDFNLVKQNYLSILKNNI
ncbi:MAG: M23 family metallopeptidase [Candidatus Atribacteria bacterium]|nr:M23 family metallopeptidase [Candidatus Atribacteria bacterium]